jgi:ornithine carbamoyltransferase
MSPQPQSASNACVAAAFVDGGTPRLKAIVLAGLAHGALKGKNIGLLCDEPSQPEALLAYRAAVELGAHVSLVRPRFEETGDPEAMSETARVLGRLYDAVACVAIPRGVSNQLRALRGVPVIDELDVAASALRMAAGCAGGTDVDAVLTTDRHFLWQLALISGFSSI